MLTTITFETKEELMEKAKAIYEEMDKKQSNGSSTLLDEIRSMSDLALARKKRIEEEDKLKKAQYLQNVSDCCTDQRLADFLRECLACSNTIEDCDRYIRLCVESGKTKGHDYLSVSPYYVPNDIKPVMTIVYATENFISETRKVNAMDFAHLLANKFRTMGFRGDCEYITYETYSLTIHW